MSRFYIATFFLVLSCFGVGFSLEGPLRWFGLGLLLGTYFILFVLGVFILKINFFVKATCRGEPTAKCVAVTFDDGPDPATTPGLLALLKSHEIEAAFFPIGAKVKEHSEIIKQIDLAGHVLGNHTFRHTWWTNFMVGRALGREIGRAQGAIENAIGKVPAYYRPPMGLTNPHLNRRLRKTGLSVIGWDVRSFDTRLSNEKMIKRVLKNIRNGSIILLHDAGKNPTDFISNTDELVVKIKERGYTFRGLEALTGIRSYQTAREAPKKHSAAISRIWRETGPGLGWTRLKRFFAKILASSHYVQSAIHEQAKLDTLKTRPPRRFLIGIGFVLVSYVLGWPMVGLFSFLAAYLQAPALLIVGPVCYGFSHLLWIFGMYLAGRESIRYFHAVLRWALRKTAKGNSNQAEGSHKDHLN